MNRYMTREIYNRLPYRDECQVYQYDRWYRAKAYKNLVFQFRGQSENRPCWDAYQVDLDTMEIVREESHKAIP